jgi:hypothetical protein
MRPRRGLIFVICCAVVEFTFAASSRASRAEPAFFIAGVGETNVESPSSSATPQTRALAAAVVEVGGDRERELEALEPMGSILSAMIASRLSLDEPAAAKVRTIVHETLISIPSKLVDAEIEAYAANLSVKELDGVLTFLKSPAGRAEKSNLPLLHSELGTIMSGPDTAKTGEQAARVFAEASPAKRAAIRRILVAQDLESHTRRGLAAFGTLVEQAAPSQSIDSGPPSGPPQSNEQKQAKRDKAARDAEDYVRLVKEVEQRYYVDHFSEEQLTAIADYLEGEAGRAMLAQLPMIQRAVGQNLRNQLVIGIPSLNGNVCAAIACSPEQRTRLADFTRRMVENLPRFDSLQL